uniref:hypothetical protein n=1 Tax=Sporichthya sp. TaxID=65475 RepID=UPI0018060E3E
GLPGAAASADSTAPRSPLVAAPGSPDMATLADDLTYTLSPQLAGMLGVPADTVLDAATAQRLTTAASPLPVGSATPPVGTTLLWPALDARESAGPLGIYLKPYTLRAVGEKIEVWVASGVDLVSAGTAFPYGDARNAVPHSTDITDAQAQSLVTEFDQRIYPKETAAFSTPPDKAGTAVLPGLNVPGVNFAGEGDHTVTLVDNVRDENFSDFPANPTYIAGFYTPIFNQLTNRNVMTIDAFDWLHRTGENPKDEATEDLVTSRPARPRSYEGVFAHEWQHLLQNYQDPAETTWVNEGLSDFAISLVGYGDTSRTVEQTRAEGHILCFQGYGEVKGPSNPNPRKCGGPQNSLTAWEDEGAGSEVLADYGNAWSFFQYLYDRYGTEFISAVHRDGTAQGLASVQKQLDTFAKGTKVTDLVHDYQVMNLVDRYVDTKGGKVAGIAKDRVTTASLNAAINLASPNAFGKAGVAPNGADYVVLRNQGADAALRSLNFTGVRSVGDGQTGAAVQNWHVSLVGIDKAGHRVLVRSMDKAFTVALTERDLKAFAGYQTVVAVISHDDPSDLDAAGEQYAGYELTTNGGTARGA